MRLTAYIVFPGLAFIIMWCIARNIWVYEIILSLTLAASLGLAFFVVLAWRFYHAPCVQEDFGLKVMLDHVKNKSG